MEVGEPVAIAMEAVEKTRACWYCTIKPGPKIKNDEEADPQTSDSESEEEVPENDEKNNASKLGDNLKSQPSWTIKCPDDGLGTTVLSAAHHCIPGNASLKKATALHDFMREGGPFALESDIGYGVNHKNNGVWLPGNYGVRNGKSNYKRGWGSFDEDFKDKYAALAMQKAMVQFHDAHPAYSKNVLDTLEAMANKLGEPGKNCPVCDKKFDKCRPPFGLVGRLDFVSGEHRNRITNLSKRKGKKAAQNGYFTSTRVKKYFGIL
jgi:hypothetical protein